MKQKEMIHNFGVKKVKQYHTLIKLLGVRYEVKINRFYRN